ncbi:MAG: methionine--tRNA ligase [Candidatus Rokubacteria bacterium]|nr:methionine--tRNA ligase [Candidatus Rokubacteria bacterium]
MTTQRRFYLTTPIYYVNATPHLGHAYTTLIADTICRYRRLAGDSVYLLTGTDEHGDKIAQAAAKAGVPPQEYTDRIAAEFRKTWDRLGVRYDDFIRTTEPRHKAVVQEILQRLWDSGEIYFGKYGGQYCYGCERFYTEKEIVDGKCPDHQTPLVHIEEENYFFKMSKYQDWLIKEIESRSDMIRPERYRNEILGFLREPLTDLSISRPRTRLEWGIPLPFDDRYVTYVWFDALINYVSALGWPDGSLFREFWSHAQHLIGKDILKPHAVYWPCMLRAAGIEPYRRLNVHGYWGLGGGKMSKSIGNVVEALALADKYGHDAFRYFLLREMVFGLDANFSEEALVARLNADLANDLGNLVSRATTMIQNFGGGAVPTFGAETPLEAELRASLEKARGEVHEAMQEFAFHRALTAVWEFIGVVNRYVDGTAPWTLARAPAQAERLRTVLYALAESLRCLSILLAAFLPPTAERIRALLGLGGEPFSLADLEWGRLAPGTQVAKATALFPRVEQGGGRQKIPGHRGSKKGAREMISMDDFSKVDLRVAQVVAAERVEKSKRLLKLTVQVGDETRTLVAGIAEHYASEELVGRKVVIVANLEPATLMGIESQGMILAASDGSSLALLALDRDLPPGAKGS